MLVRRDLRYSHYLNRSTEKKTDETKPFLSVPGKWKSRLNVGLKFKKGALNKFKIGCTEGTHKSK
jgi:hypothetical protein